MGKYKWKLRSGRRNISKQATDDYITPQRQKTGSDCITGKIGYPYLKMARRAQRIMVSKTKSTTLQIYICRNCGMYHLGNKFEGSDNSGDQS